MSQGHVHELSSAAYDGALTAAQRRSFDSHLAQCPACAAAFAELSTAVDALRELGPVPMPRPVQLPAGAPGVRTRTTPGWLRLPARHPWASGLAGAVVALAAAVSVLVPHLTPTAGLSPSSASKAAGESGNAVPASASASAFACPAGVAASPQSPEAVPGGFTNHEVEDNGSSTVVIATEASAYSPGEAVDVYARVIDDSSQVVQIPCAYLVAPGQAGVHSGGSAAESLGIPAELAPNQAFQPDGPLLRVTVPATATPGETLQVAVEVPAMGGQPAHQATLAFQVS